MKVLHYDVPINDADQAESKMIELLTSKAKGTDGPCCIARYDSDMLGTALFVLYESDMPPETPPFRREEHGYKLVLSQPLA